jgi:outer membrane cobalamin receptor
MRARKRISARFARAASVCLLTAVGGCAISAGGGRPINDSHFGDVVLSGEEIDAQHARNAWDFLRARVHRYSYIEDRSGRAVAIRGHRGRSSILLDSDSPIVVVDGARLVAFDVLQGMPTSAIDRIQILSGLRGTSWEGTGATAGVIYIFTRSGSN